MFTFNKVDSKQLPINLLVVAALVRSNLSFAVATYWQLPLCMCYNGGLCNFFFTDFVLTIRVCYHWAAGMAVCVCVTLGAMFTHVHP